MSELKALERAMETIMEKANTNVVKKYAVENLSRYYNSDCFETIEEATADARRRSWESGSDYGIFSLVATASSTELVNTVKVTTIQ